MFRNSSVVKIYIIRPKPGQVAKNATPRPSGACNRSFPYIQLIKRESRLYLSKASFSMSLWLTMLWFDILWEKGINKLSLSNLFPSPKSMSLNQSWKRGSLVSTDTVQATFAFNQPYLGKGLMKLLLILNVLSMSVFMMCCLLFVLM